MSLYKNFTFPLNVYSDVLYKDYGSVEYLHYGLFDPDNCDIKAAQQRATDLLFSHLPPAPCRILEVGIGLGTLLVKLTAAGYDVTGITPDDKQINYSRVIHGTESSIAHQRLEDFADTRKFDLILFQESAQYIDTANLFQKASELLNDNGRILIMDEISLRKTSPSEPGLPLLDAYLAIGEAAGFEIIEQLDLSRQASPTNSYILDSVTRYRPQLTGDLDLSDGDIDGLLAATRQHIAKYNDGRYGYCLLSFKKRAPQTITWSNELAKPEHEAELLALFRAAYGYQMPIELWRWKYHDLDTLGTSLRHEGQLAAFYGGMPRAVRLFGSPATAVQIGDVMVAPEARGALTRKGPFFHTAADFLQRFVGQDKKFPIAFGFPSERAYRLAEHLGLYEKAGELMRVSWPALQARPSFKIRLRPLKPDQGATVDRLWHEMADALQDQVIGVRDWAYLQHRYLNHPTQTYQLYLASTRLTGTPIGILAIRVLDDAVELLDIVSAPKHIATLVHCLKRLTWSLNKTSAYAWITAHNAELLAGAAGKIDPAGIIIPHNHLTPGLPASELLNRWWLMGGDTDFR